MKQSIDDKLDELLDINNEAEEVVKETKRRARRVKEELGDVVDQAKDVVEAAKGSTRRGRKPKAKK